MLSSKRKKREEADLDITSFMNLMIVLVPVLLMMMVFSHITVLDLQLPKSAELPADVAEQPKSLELLVREDALEVFYPSGYLIKRIELIEQEYDYELLQLTLKEIKRQLEEKGEPKTDITLLLEPDTDYQTIIKLMDTVRSYKAVVVASVVDAELFPLVSLGDAPAQIQYLNQAPEAVAEVSP